MSLITTATEVQLMEGGNYTRFTITVFIFVTKGFQSPNIAI